LLQITELSLGVEYQRNLEHIDLFSKPGTQVEFLDTEAWEEATVVALNASSEHCCRCVVGLEGGRTLEVPLGFVRLPQKSAASPPSRPKRARKSRSRSAPSSVDADPERWRAEGAEEDFGSPGLPTPGAIRQRYMKLEREKACVQQGARYYVKPRNYKAHLAGHEPGYRTCKLQDFRDVNREREARPQGAPEQGQEKEQPGLRDAHRLSSKRQRELAEVYHKYGIAGGPRKAASRPETEVEAPDTFRLG